jgi:hypothetical protein
LLLNCPFRGSIRSNYGKLTHIYGKYV